jgi:8-hydroxy-5-deazaflavin:NADPH oxidoreductase
MSTGSPADTVSPAGTVTSMNIGIFGTGIVGQVLAQALAAQGHTVRIGTRDVAASLGRLGSTATGYGEPFGLWAQHHPEIQVMTFREAAEFGELLINATNGTGSPEALEQAGAAALGSKVMLDASNPLDFSKGMPPTLSVSNTDSLAETLQRQFPELRIVKSLNTMNAHLMLNPATLAGGDHTVFLSGNDAQAKQQVGDLLRSAGWSDILDLGDLSSARGAEMILPLWLSVWGVMGNTPFQFKVVR